MSDQQLSENTLEALDLIDQILDLKPREGEKYKHIKKYLRTYDKCTDRFVDRLKVKLEKLK